MSYDLIRGIKVKEDGVYLLAAANNLYPRRFNWWMCEGFTKILNTKGQKALDIEMLKQYDNGNFQPGTPNKYSRAVKRLHLMPEYKDFDWRYSDNEQYEKNNANRETPAFDELLYRAFTDKGDRRKWIIVKKHWGSNYYVRRLGSRHIFYTNDVNKAKRFDLQGEAQGIIERAINDPHDHEVSSAPAKH